MKIINAANLPIFARAGSVPDVSGAMQDYFQPMTLTRVEKTMQGFQVVETPTSYNAQGVIMPFKERQLQLKPEGQRAWSWHWLFTDTSIVLQVDDVVTVTWQAPDELIQSECRVMSRKNYWLSGYVEYQIVQDWKDVGPL